MGPPLGPGAVGSLRSPRGHTESPVHPGLGHSWTSNCDAGRGARGRTRGLLTSGWVLANRLRLRLALGCIALGSAALTLFLMTGVHAAAASQGGTAISAHGSVEQVYVTGLPSGARMTLLDRKGRAIATKPADDLGGLLFRNVRPGTGYRVRLAGGGAKSGPLT